MTTTGTRPVAARRRAGYVIGALLNAVLLVLIDFSPGWSAVPFLTDGVHQVLVLVNVVVLAGLVTNLGYLVDDAPRLVALGGVVTPALGVAAVIRLWQVFPFDFADGTAWPVLVRVLLVLGIAGGAIAIVVNLVALVRGGPGKPQKDNEKE